MKKIILLALLAIISYTRTSAQDPDVVLSDKTGWYKIGETTVDFATETDKILVLGADRFQSIKIKVADAPINLVSFVIYFESGDNQNVTIEKDITSPGETQVVALDGGERRIKKIAFIYKTIPNSEDKKAHIELWGLKTNLDKMNK